MKYIEFEERVGKSLSAILDAFEEATPKQRKSFFDRVVLRTYTTGKHFKDNTAVILEMFMLEKRNGDDK